MKKTVLAFAAFLALQAGAALAAPVNDLSRGQTAVGLSSDTFYLEHQISNSFTLGLQNVNWNNSGSMDDIYGQFKLDNNLRGIIGNRDLSAKSELYLGLAVNGPIAPEWKGHASFVAGSEFKEMQAGASYALTHNVDLNLNYHSFMPDSGKNRNGADFGATFKF